MTVVCLPPPFLSLSFAKATLLAQTNCRSRIPARVAMHETNKTTSLSRYIKWDMLNCQWEFPFRGVLGIAAPSTRDLDPQPHHIHQLGDDLKSPRFRSVGRGDQQRMQEIGVVRDIPPCPLYTDQERQFANHLLLTNSGAIHKRQLTLVPESVTASVSSTIAPFTDHPWNLKKEVRLPLFEMVRGCFSCRPHTFWASYRRSTQHARKAEKEENEGSLGSGLYSRDAGSSADYSCVTWPSRVTLQSARFGPWKKKKKKKSHCRVNEPHWRGY